MVVVLRRRFFGLCYATPRYAPWACLSLARRAHSEPPSHTTFARASPPSSSPTSSQSAAHTSPRTASISGFARAPGTPSTFKQEQREERRGPSRSTRYPSNQFRVAALKEHFLAEDGRGQQVMQILHALQPNTHTSSSSMVGGEDDAALARAVADVVCPSGARACADADSFRAAMQQASPWYAHTVLWRTTALVLRAATRGRGRGGEAVPMPKRVLKDATAVVDVLLDGVAQEESSMGEEAAGSASMDAIPWLLSLLQQHVSCATMVEKLAMELRDDAHDASAQEVLNALQLVEKLDARTKVVAQRARCLLDAACCNTSSRIQLSQTRAINALNQATFRARGLLIHMDAQKRSSNTNASTSSRGGASSRPLRDLALCHFLWSLHALTTYLHSLGPKTWPSQTTNDVVAAVEQLERLWQSLAGEEKLPGDVHLCHRSIHRALNVKLARIHGRRIGITTSALPPSRFSLDEATTVLRMVQALMNEAQLVLQPAMAAHVRAPRGSSMMTSLHISSVMLRMSMDVEQHLGCWADLIAHKHKEWLVVEQASIHLRATLSTLIFDLFSLLVRAEEDGTTEGGSSAATPRHTRRRPPHVATQFLAQMHVNYYSLLRRHYVLTHQRAIDTSREKIPVDAATRQILSTNLAVFMLLRSLAPPLDLRKDVDAENSDDHHPHQRNSHAQQATAAGPSACGTHLSQAMEVAFFLQVWMDRVKEPPTTANNNATQMPFTPAMAATQEAAATLLSAEAIREYSVEMLFLLELSTAKQLWHLRSTKKFFYFSGLRQDRSFIEDEHLQRRFAQSVLSVVHAHVMHPSLLWMPLWQLEEFVLILSRNRNLLMMDLPSSSSSSITPTTEVNAEADDATRANALMDEGTSPRSTMPPRAPVRIGGITTNLARLHSYLVLRLYVTSNTLREYREKMEQQESSGQSGFAHQQQPDLFATLAQREPGAEKVRRKHRVWSQTIAELLATEYAGLAAEVEGTTSNTHGAKKVLARLERTIYVALQHHLFFNVRRERKRARRAIPKEDVAAAAPSTSTCTEARNTNTRVRLELRRSSANAPLGFVLDASCLVTRVKMPVDELGADDEEEELMQAYAEHGGPSSKNEREEETEEPPFVVAARAAGLDAGSLVGGWRVCEVDDHATTTAKDVLRWTQGKAVFQLTLAAVGANDDLDEVCI